MPGVNNLQTLQVLNMSSYTFIKNTIIWSLSSGSLDVVLWDTSMLSSMPSLNVFNFRLDSTTFIPSWFVALK